MRIYIRAGIDGHSSRALEASSEALQELVARAWKVLNRDYLWSSWFVLGNYRNVDLWLLHSAQYDASCLRQLLNASRRLRLEAIGYEGNRANLLCAAAMNNNRRSLRHLRKRGADIDIPDYQGLTALTYAAWNFHVDATEYLLRHKADVDMRLRSADTILLSMLGQVIPASNEYNGISASGGATVSIGDKHMLRSAFPGPPVEGPRSEFFPSLFEAVMFSLIPASKNLELRDRHGSTALGRAAAGKEWAIVCKLLDHGAKVNVSNDKGVTPLLASLQLRESHQVVRDFTVDSASLGIIGDIMVGAGPEQAPQHPSEAFPALQRLIGSCDDLEIIDSEGRTALSLAAESGNPDAVKLLLDRGANIDHRDKQQLTPLMLACRLPRQHTISVENVQVRGHSNLFIGGIRLLDPHDLRTGLHEYRFLQIQREATVQLLLEHGADPNLGSANCETAILLAMKDNMPNLVKLLRANGALEPPSPPMTTSLDHPFMECFNQVFRTPVEIQNLTVSGASKWRWGVGIDDRFNSTIHLLPEDFTELSRCDVRNLKISDHSEVEIGSLVFVTQDTGPVLAIVTQYPGHTYRDIEVKGSSVLQTSVLSAEPPSGVARIVYEYLRKNRKFVFGRNVPREFKKKRQPRKLTVEIEDVEVEGLTVAQYEEVEELRRAQDERLRCALSRSPSRSHPASW